MDQAPEEAQSATRPGLATRALLAVIAGYRFFLSPLVGQHCRFHPSCSLYAREALLTHGFLRGSALAAWRLLRCHPFAPGGLDPVPGAGPAHPPRLTDTLS